MVVGGYLAYALLTTLAPGVLSRTAADAPGLPELLSTALLLLTVLVVQRHDRHAKLYADPLAPDRPAPGTGFVERDFQSAAESGFDAFSTANAFRSAGPGPGRPTGTGTASARGGVRTAGAGQAGRRI